MPYVDKGDKVCRPSIDREVRKGEIIVTYPALLKVNKELVMFPPLSIISPNCDIEIESPNWVDGYLVTGNEKIEILDGETELAKGEINVLCSRILTGYTLKKILGTIEVPISKERLGIPLITINEIPLVSINRDRVILHTSVNIPILRTFALSLFYYISSSSES